MHLLSGGHPVLDQHRQRQPIPTTHVHADHHVASRPYGAGLPGAELSGLDIANYNAPTQTVIAGPADAVNRAL
ncbi:hypothetical protein AB0H94_36925, partial [Streptomyces purpurascens]|uniref:hypothetical protein n=1 Tax=Streptomyces purpurascens TaxID=1924 RepID=UPI0033D0B100